MVDFPTAFDNTTGFPRSKLPCLIPKAALRASAKETGASDHVACRVPDEV